jgi:hypothetical protein
MAVTNWDLEGETLVRELTFRDFNEAFAFAGEVAEGAVDAQARGEQRLGAARRGFPPALHRAADRVGSRRSWVECRRSPNR